MPEHTYGPGGTIHRTGTIDIQADPDGNIVRVWFRCLSLPFTVSRVNDRQYYNPADEGMEIRSIAYGDSRSDA